MESPSIPLALSQLLLALPQLLLQVALLAIVAVRGLLVPGQATAVAASAAQHWHAVLHRPKQQQQEEEEQGGCTQHPPHTRSAAVGEPADVESERAGPAEPLPEGYQASVGRLRQQEFSRLQGKVYADYAGAAPYSEALLRQACQQLSTQLFGNPHSEAGWGEADAGAAAATAARRLTLSMCNASLEEYECIFTAGATAALKLVGEAFPWAAGEISSASGRPGTGSSSSSSSSGEGASPAPAIAAGESMSNSTKAAGGGSVFLYLRDNHNSVLGIRQLAANGGAAACAAVEIEACSTSGSGAGAGDAGSGSTGAFALRVCSSAAVAAAVAAAAAAPAATGVDRGQQPQEDGQQQQQQDQQHQHLFAFPLESNFHGVKYDPALITAVQAGRAALLLPSGTNTFSSSSSAANGSTATGGSLPVPLPPGRWRVLLDAAKGAGTQPPDLGKHPADFVALSFYKIFGWPTGLGALLVRKEALSSCLRKPYFSGGTLLAAAAEEPFHRLRPGAAGWEDGTLSFLSLPAVTLGFDFVQQLGGFPAVAAHAGAVAGTLAAQLASLRHHNGRPVCVLYGAHAAAAAAAAAGEEEVRQEARRQEAERAAGVGGPNPWQLQQALACSKGLERSRVLRHRSKAHASQSHAAAGGSGGGWADVGAAGAAGALSVSRASSVAGTEEAASAPTSAPTSAPASAFYTPYSASAASTPAGAATPPRGGGSSSGLEQQRWRQQQQQQQQQQQAGVVGQGPVVTFNLLRADGSPVGYREVEQLASLHGIRLRTGCLCNPGACAAALGLTPADIRSNYEAGHVCWDSKDVVQGRATGVVRASFGYASSLADADAIAELVQRYFVDAAPGTAAPDLAAPGAAAVKAAAEAAAPGAAAEHPLPAVAAAEAALAAPPPRAQPPPQQQLPSEQQLPPAPAAAAVVQSLYVYPIKSCRGFRVDAWPLGPTGLLYDRHWLLVDLSGTALRLKTCPALATVCPAVDLARGLLVVSAAPESGVRDLLEIPLPAVSQPAAAAAGRAHPSETAAGRAHPSEAAASGDGGTTGEKRDAEFNASGKAARSGGSTISVRVCARTVCSERVGGAGCGEEAAVSAWFERVLGMPCRLVQQADVQGQVQTAHRLQQQRQQEQQMAGTSASAESQRQQRSFANEGQLLLCSRASAEDLQRRVAAAAEVASMAKAGSKAAGRAAVMSMPSSSSVAQEPLDTFLLRFRPNIVVGGSGLQPYEEERWGRLRLGGALLENAGACPRCDMVCADPCSGRRSGPQPLLALAAYRRRGGQIRFGLLLNRGEEAREEMGEEGAAVATGSGAAAQLGPELQRLGLPLRIIAAGMAVIVISS